MSYSKGETWQGCSGSLYLYAEWLVSTTVKFLLTAETAEMTLLLGEENTNKQGGEEIRFLNSLSEEYLPYMLTK